MTTKVKVVPYTQPSSSTSVSSRTFYTSISLAKPVRRRLYQPLSCDLWKMKIDLYLARRFPFARLSETTVQELMDFGSKKPSMQLFPVPCLSKKLGGGHEGHVFELGEKYAVKILKLVSGEDTNQILRRMMRLVEIAGPIGHHRNVNSFEGLCYSRATLGIGKPARDDRFGLVFSKISGRNLSDLFFSLTHQEKLAIAIDIALGLQHLDEAGISHSDLNLDNVMITTDKRAILIDYLLDYTEQGSPSQDRLTNRRKFGEFYDLYICPPDDQIDGHYSHFAKQCCSDCTMEEFGWDDILKVLSSSLDSSSSGV